MKKNETKQSAIAGVNDFERLRGYLEKIYLFGCYTRKNLAVICGRSADDVSKAVGALRSIDFFDKCLKTSTSKKNQYYVISREYKNSGNLSLSDVYMLRPPFSDKEKTICSYILSELNGGSWSTQHFVDAFEVDKRTVKARIAALRADGYIEMTGKKYALVNKDVLSELKNRNKTWLIALYRYIQFTSAATYPRVAGSFLLRTLSRELNKGDLDKLCEPKVIMRHSACKSVLDEVLLYQLLFAVADKRWIKIKVGNYGELEPALPIEIRLDSELGRWYCVFLHFYEDKIEPHFVSLAKMKILMSGDYVTNKKEKAACWEKLRKCISAESGEHDEVWESAKEKIKETLRRNRFSNTRIKREVTITVSFLFEEEDNKNRFESESKRFDVISIAENNDGAVEYKIKTTESKELLPLLRAYSPYIINMESEEDDLCELLYERTKEICVGGGDGETITTAKELQQIEKLNNTNKGKTLNLNGVLFSAFQNQEFQNNSASGLTMSGFERDYLRYVLQLPEAKLFLPDDLIESLLREVKPWRIDLGGEIINRFNDSDKEFKYDKPYRENFGEIRNAIYNNYSVKLRINGISKKCYPWKFEYRGIDHRWWLIYCDEQGPKREPLEKIESVERIPNEVSNAFSDKAKNIDVPTALEKNIEKTIKLYVFNERNALDRCLLAMENYEAKKLEYLGKDINGVDVFELTLNIYDFFYEEFVRTLLRLGAKVRYINGPDALTNMFKDKLEKALENLKPLEKSTERTQLDEDLSPEEDEEIQ